MGARDEATRAGAVPTAFACHIPVGPSQVWSALTDASQTTAYLYGLALHSTWAPEALIDARLEDRPALSGRVLCFRPDDRLSYVLYAEPDDPPVYLTWLIRPSPSGCTLRLQIDEVDYADTAEEAENTWLPVLAALQRLLDPR
jgi:uncharacterized protein YndB with AHSA1/START domain